MKPVMWSVGIAAVGVLAFKVYHLALWVLTDPRNMEAAAEKIDKLRGRSRGGTTA